MVGLGSDGGSRKAGGPVRSSASSGDAAAASLAVSGGRFHFSSTSLSTEVWSSTSLHTYPGREYGDTRPPAPGTRTGRSDAGPRPGSLSTLTTRGNNGRRTDCSLVGRPPGCVAGCCPAGPPLAAPRGRNSRHARRTPRSAASLQPWPCMTRLITSEAKLSPFRMSCGFSSEYALKSGSTMLKAGSVPLSRPRRTAPVLWVPHVTAYAQRVRSAVTGCPSGPGRPAAGKALELRTSRRAGPYCLCRT